MPPSQLKRLRSSLRDQGIIGPQKSKKQKKQNAQNGISKEKKVSRGLALTGIREQFNPFEFKAPSRKPKFEATTELSAKPTVRRPGLAKSQQEEMHWQTYLKDQQRRRKVGGILDRRFGESDPTMTPEEKMLQRFTREKQLRHQNSSVFDLEDNDAPGELTHMGKSLSLDDPVLADDFAEDDVELSDVEDYLFDERHMLKRSVSDLEYRDGHEDVADDKSRPQRKKSKQEVMKEVIAKSKLLKYERQAAKDDDDDLREELDKGMVDIHILLREMPAKLSRKPATVSSMNPERAALLSGKDQVKFNKEYDLRMRQMAQDKKSQPTEKSKTEDEVLAERARKLQELESLRLRRMQGESVDSEEETEPKNKVANEEEAEGFGFGTGIKVRPPNAELGVEDEDEFIIDNNLIASGSEMEDLDNGSDDENMDGDDQDDEFLTDFVAQKAQNRSELLTGTNTLIPEEEMPAHNGVNGDLAYKFSCPESHDEFLDITKKVHILDLPTVVQRIRAFNHPQLHRDNKKKLAKFSSALVDHVFYLANQEEKPPFAILEALIRHIHSLAKSFTMEITNRFRYHLQQLDSSRALSPTPGDMILLTAIGTIFPTSDHFHQVVTPAMLSMGRYLGLKVPQYLHEFAVGAYLCTLCLHYQRLSRRYVPEVLNSIQNTLCVLAPTQMANSPIRFPYHEPKMPLRIRGVYDLRTRLHFYDCTPRDRSHDEEDAMKVTLLDTNLYLLDSTVDLWAGKEAFVEIFQPCWQVVQHLLSPHCLPHFSAHTQQLLNNITQHLEEQLAQARQSRRPLELHHHRPLAIATSTPKFEPSFHPSRHYDPDRTRTESAQLHQLHRREKKGAIRDLRREARGAAVHSLREKRAIDAAYDRKMKRLVAEIQGDEGRQKNAYEREKMWRSKSRGLR